MSKTRRSSILRAILARRDELALSTSELARRADVSRADLSRYLAGERHLRSDTLQRLADALGLYLAQR